MEFPKREVQQAQSKHNQGNQAAPSGRWSLVAGRA